jgi:hypothetical protein
MPGPTHSFKVNHDAAREPIGVSLINNTTEERP